MTPKYHLIIPQLLQPLNSWNTDFLFKVQAPNLSELLRYYSIVQGSKTIHSFYSALFTSDDSSELPVAYYRQQLQLNTKYKHIVCADPVYFEVSMNDVTLTNKINDLSDSEAREMIDLLNLHFAQDGLQFVMGSNQHWYIVSEEDEQLQSHDIDAVYLSNIIEKLSTSKRRNWQRIQNEIQMVLHNAEINQQREIAGLSPINSVWVWGAGKPIAPRFCAKRVVSGNEPDAVLKGQLLAAVEQCDWQALPDDGKLLITDDSSVNVDHLILFNQLFEPAIENKLDDFQQQLTFIDTVYIGPLLKAWKQKRITIEINSCDGQIISPLHPSWWAFGKKPVSLHTLSKSQVDT